MKNGYSLHLQQVRTQLEDCANSTAGLSVLLSLRRELARLLQGVPLSYVDQAPISLRTAFERRVAELTAPAPFPAPNWSVRFEQTQQALAVLEQIAQRHTLSLPAGGIYAPSLQRHRGKE